MFYLSTSEVRDLLKSAPLSAVLVHCTRSSASRVTSDYKFKANTAMTCHGQTFTGRDLLLEAKLVRKDVEM
jgi:hypothetical protein